MTTESRWWTTLRLLLVVRALLLCAPTLVTSSSSSVRQLASTTDSWNTTSNASTALIVGGVPAEVGAYPWFAHPDGFRFGCGASLIYPDILITAAHCTSVRYSFVRTSLLQSTGRVHIGGNRRDGSDAIETIPVEIQRGHPLYISSAYDFMLVKLQYNSTAVPVKWNSNPTIPADGEPLIIIGYGNTRSLGRSSKILLQGEVKAVNFNSCQTAYNTPTGIYTNQTLDRKTMLCAANPGVDTCQGDSGGPIIRKRDGLLVGITSFGNGCALPEYPGVYSRISGAVDFIKDGICELSHSPPSYCVNRTKSNACNTCAGMLFRIGTQLHRTVFGRCIEICNILAFSVGRWKERGWECGPCP